MIYAKIFGWALIIAGIGLIVWTLASSYNMFTGKDAVPEIFYAPVIIGSVQTGDIQAQLENMVKDQLKNLIPTDAITKTLNLAVWSVLAMILIFGGGQIANIGIKLISRPEKQQIQ